MAGTLYLVGTPIGNLEDITLRALRVLQEADLIACEDTRQTRKLLARYSIHRPLVSCHEHNEAARAEELAGKAAAGATIALVTDAGMPGISDPGSRVVRQALRRGVPVVPVPGPVAAATAFSAAGFAGQAYRCGGFLPPRRGQRRKALEALARETATLIFYEAPHRILNTLEDVVALFGARPVVVARELTKIHEEFLRGPADQVLGELQRRPAIKGEITLLIAPAERQPAPRQPIRQRVEELIGEQGLSRMAAIKQAAREQGIPKREAYRQSAQT